MIYYANQCDAEGREENEFVYAPGWQSITEHPIFRGRPVRLPEERFLSYLISVIESDGGYVQDPAQFPPWLRFKRREKVIQDVYCMRGWYLFSTRLRAKVEEMEPGVHQFIPIRLLQSDGSDFGDKYHAFNLFGHFFSIDVDLSPCYRWVLLREYPEHKYKSYQLRFDRGAKPGRSKDGHPFEIVHRASIVGNRMFWRERLDLNVPPNTGERAWVRESDGGVYMRVVVPYEPAEWNSYRIEKDFGFRVRDTFKTWFETEGLTGLEFLTPGCLDTELEDKAP